MDRLLGKRGLESRAFGFAPRGAKLELRLAIPKRFAIPVHC